MQTKDIEIIGFDLGHGESALAYTTLAGASEPEPLELMGETAIITAVGEHPTRGTLIGERAIMARAELPNLYIRFKDPALDAHPFAGKALRLFVRQVLKMLGSERQVKDIANALFFVGCPSGWERIDPTLPKRYEHLLRQAGLPQVRVVPESRAAFLHAREAGDCHVSLNQLAKQVLLIDIGSSTTDITISQDFNSHPIDFGDIRLGGGLIDELLFKRALERHSRRQALERLFEERPALRSACEIKCRRLKQTFFAAQRHEPDAKFEDSVRLESGLYFEVLIDKGEIKTVLQLPIPELDNRTWPEAFRYCLERARQEMGGRQPELIILTGGGARMGFLTEIAQAIFPKVLMVRGKTPELAIAKGLAWFGRLDLKSKSFQQEVDTLLGTGNFKDIIKNSLPELFSHLAKKIAEGLIEEVVKPAVKEWRSGRFDTLKNLEEVIARRSESWIKGEEGRSAIREAVTEWFGKVRYGIERLTEPVCERYGLPKTALSLSTDTYLLSTKLPSITVGDPFGLEGGGFTTLLNLIISMVMAKVAGSMGTALLIKGPIGWIIGFVISFIVLIAGIEKAREWVKEAHLLLVVRKLLTDSRLNAQMEKSKPEFIAGLEKALTEAEEKAISEAKLAERIETGIKMGIVQRADDAILRF